MINRNQVLSLQIFQPCTGTFRSGEIALKEENMSSSTDRRTRSLWDDSVFSVALHLPTSPGLKKCLRQLATCGVSPAAERLSAGEISAPGLCRSGLETRSWVAQPVLLL